MKKLLPLLLGCLLLCGCADKTAQETAPPTESVTGETRSLAEYGGAVQCTALNLDAVQGMLLFGEDVLLLSGQEHTTLTLLDAQTLQQRASTDLSCFLPPEDLTLSPEGNLSFYNREDSTIWVLDASLQEIRRIPIPGTISGKPILWNNTVFYCTPSEIRAWDLETNIRRRVKEMAFEDQSLTGVLMEGALLRCRVTDGSQTQTLFLSSADGHLLQCLPGDCSLYTHSTGFYGTLTSGGYSLPVFGETSAHLLTPRDLEAVCSFLPEQKGAVTAAGGLLEYYDLETGLRRCILPLEICQTPTAVVGLSGDRILILTRDLIQDQELLITWDIGPGNSTAVRDDTVYVQPYYSAQAPDSAGLEHCARRARELGEPLGLTIRLWKDAAEKNASGHTLEPEHQVPLIQRELTLLDQRLRQYPKNLLKKTAARFTSLNLCLVRSVSGSGCGTFFLDGADAYVILPMGSGGEQALAHGLFHAMEIHIFSESHALDQWNQLNPAGFQYDYDYAANQCRDSGVYLFQEQRSFVDTFSMSFPKEDRARIFEYAMAEGQKALFLPPSMQRKLQILSAGIREAYEMEANEGLFSWEQYLK